MSWYRVVNYRTIIGNSTGNRRRAILFQDSTIHRYCASLCSRVVPLCLGTFLRCDEGDTLSIRVIGLLFTIRDYKVEFRYVPINFLENFNLYLFL